VSLISVASNVASFVRSEGNIESNIAIVALNVALFVRPEGNKSLIKHLPGVPHAQPLSYLS